jgi:hypothetical protein
MEMGADARVRPDVQNRIALAIVMASPLSAHSMRCK